MSVEGEGSVLMYLGAGGTCTCVDCRVHESCGWTEFGGGDKVG